MNTFNVITLNETMRPLFSMTPAVIIDTLGGEAIGGLYDPDCDIVLDPTHSNGARWDIWQDVISAGDATALVGQLFGAAEGSDPFWLSLSGRVLFAMLTEMKVWGIPTFERLQVRVFGDKTAPTQRPLYDVDGKAELAARALLHTAMKPLECLAECSGEPFSFRAWQAKGEGRVFIRKDTWPDALVRYWERFAATLGVFHED